MTLTSLGGEDAWFGDRCYDVCTIHVVVSEPWNGNQATVSYCIARNNADSSRSRGIIAVLNVGKRFRKLLNKLLFIKEGTSQHGNFIG